MKNSMEIFLKTLFVSLLIKIHNGNNDLQSVYIVRSSKNNCWTSLMEITDLPDDRFSASSSFQNRSTFQAHQARLLYIYRSNPQPENGNAWCPHKKASSHFNEWIEVDFKSINVINGIFTKGRGEGNFVEFVPTIKIAYQRERNGRIYEYQTIENQSLIPINTDARTQSRTKFIPAIIASSIKIYPVDPYDAQMICIKFALFGCDFHDSPVSYSTFDGDNMSHHKSVGITTSDRYFDGDKIRQNSKILLKNGLGLLTDNRAWLGSLEGLRDPYFLGWYVSNASPIPYIPISFEYEKRRNFTKLQIFSYQLPSQTIDIFSKVNLKFQSNTKLESEIEKDVSRANVQMNRFGGVIFTMLLSHNVGNMVKLQLHATNLNRWILVSEINFVSSLAAENFPQSEVSENLSSSKLKPNIQKRNTTEINRQVVQRKNNENFVPNISGRDIFLDSEKDTTLTVATISGLILLVIFISIIAVIFYKMKQKRQYKKNSKIQYMIGNEIGSIYQQYSQTEKIKSFLSPNLQQSHSLTSDNSSFDCPVGRILDTSIYSSLPHKTTKDAKTIRDDERYLLKEYNNNNNNTIMNPSSAFNISPFSNKENTIKNPSLTTYSWTTNEQLYKTNGHEYASATLFPSSYPGIQYKRPSGSSIMLKNDCLSSPAPSPYHLIKNSPLFPNSPLGMSQLPATIQIIANPYFDHIDKTSVPTSNDIPTPVASHKSYSILSNDSNTPSPYSMSKNSLMCWTSPEANYFSNFDFSKLMQIQSVCGHIYFGLAEIDSMDTKRPMGLIDTKLPRLQMSSITTAELISQGQYGQNKKAILNESLIRSRNLSGYRDEILNRKLSTENCTVILTSLNDCSSSEARSKFYNEIQIRLRLSNPNIAAILAIVTDSVEGDFGILNHQCGFITECFMNLHVYIRLQTTEKGEITKPLTDCAYPFQSPETLNYGSLIFIASQIASGMKHMEEQGILHRDLACRSCMVNMNLQVKITNGGHQISSPFDVDYLSIPLSDYTSIHLPIRWMAPESLFNAKFSSKSDVWAFGVTLWEVLTHCNQQPYYYWSNSQVMDNLYNILLAQNSQFHYLTRPKICPKEIYDMIRECWHPTEDYRPNFHEIHMFLQRKCIGYFNTENGFSRPMI